MRNSLSFDKAIKLADYLRARAGENEHIDGWRSDIAKDASIALGFEINAGHVARITKDLGISIREAARKTNGAHDHNVEVLINRLACIERKVNRILSELEIPDGES